MTIISCECCGKPRPDHVKSCPYCKGPSASDNIKKFINKAGGGAGAVLSAVRSVSDEAENAAYRKSIRTCLVCGYRGPMKGYLSEHAAPIIISIILLFLWVVPGLIYIAVYWDKRKCPSCGAIGKNSDPLKVPTQETGQHKTCPFCAETIKAAATVCKHCQRELTAV